MLPCVGGVTCDSPVTWVRRSVSECGAVGPVAVRRPLVRPRSDMSWPIKLCSGLSVALGLAAVANAQVSPGGVASGQPATYAVDGRPLGSRLASDRSLRD